MRVWQGESTLDEPVSATIVRVPYSLRKNRWYLQTNANRLLCDLDARLAFHLRQAAASAVSAKGWRKQ